MFINDNVVDGVKNMAYGIVSCIEINVFADILARRNSGNRRRRRNNESSDRQRRVTGIVYQNIIMAASKSNGVWHRRQPIIKLAWQRQNTGSVTISISAKKKYDIAAKPSAK